MYLVSNSCSTHIHHNLRHVSDGRRFSGEMEATHNITEHIREGRVNPIPSSHCPFLFVFGGSRSGRAPPGGAAERPTRRSLRCLCKTSMGRGDLHVRPGCANGLTGKARRAGGVGKISPICATVSAQSTQSIRDYYTTQFYTH